MSETFARELRVIPCFCKDESPLDNSLRVPSQTFGGPIIRDAALTAGQFNIGLQRGRMIENAGSAGIADAGEGHVNLLSHRSDQTAGLRQILRDDRFTKRDIGKHPVQRVAMVMIGRRDEEVRSGPGPKFRSRDSQRFLAAEVVEECPFGYLSRLTKIIDAGRGEAFGANGVSCGFKESVSGITALRSMFGWSGHSNIHTVRLVYVNDRDPALKKSERDMNSCDDDLVQFAEHGAPLLPTPDHEDRVEHNGALIWYASFGSGPPVILLHGGLGHSGNWGYQVPALVAAGHRVVTIDSRGHGRSTRDDRPYSYELMASDVAAVMDHLSLDRAALVGWSDGACVALVFASKAPARAAGVFFFACNMDPGGTKQIEPSPLLDRCFSRHRKDYTTLSATPADFDQFVSAVGLMMRTQPNYTKQDLGTIEVPVFVALGEHDEFIKREHASYLAEVIPGATLNILPGVSHFAPLQRPDEFNETVLAFTTEVSPRVRTDDQ